MRTSTPYQQIHERETIRSCYAKGMFFSRPLQRQDNRVDYDDGQRTSPFVAQRVNIGSDRVEFDLDFAFGSVDSYKTIIYARAFEEGQAMRMITNHEWNSTFDSELGVGHVYTKPNTHSDSLDNRTAALRGVLAASSETDPTIERFLTVYNALVEARLQPEVSVGFFGKSLRYHPELLFDHEDPETDGLTDQELEAGAYVAFDKVDGVEVSSVYRGAVPGTTMKLFNAEPASATGYNLTKPQSATTVARHRAQQALRRANKRKRINV